MVSNADLPEFMKKSLLDAYHQMSRVKTRHQFELLMQSAPSFIFTKTNDFMQAIQADYIIVLVPPDKYYEFEVLCHDPYRSRVIVNSMEFKRITQDKYKQIIMDNYPIDVTS
jgi:hypothetical protein